MAKEKDSSSSVVTSSTTASRKTRFAGFRRKKKMQHIHMEEQDGVDQTRGHHGFDIMGSKEAVPITTVRAPLSIAAVEEEEEVKTNGADIEKYFQQRKNDRMKVNTSQGGNSFFTRSARFQKMVDNVFVSIDTDNSGEVDKDELYAGLILIHLRLAAYVGPAACRPATKEYVEEIFDLLDVDESGELNREEFGTVMALLVSQITTRVFMYLVFPLAIIPFAAEFLVGLLSGIEMDERIIAFANTTINVIVPEGMNDFFLASMEKVDNFIPDDLLEKLPLMFITTMLGFIALPWAVIQMDAFFNKMAASKKKGKKSS